MLLRLWVSLVLSTVVAAIKDPKRAESVKGTLIELRDQLNILYPPGV